jgi:hypothetical protein
MSERRRVLVTAGALLLACGSRTQEPAPTAAEPEAPARPEAPGVAAVQPVAPEAPPRTRTWPASTANALPRCEFFADANAPSAAGAMGLLELDARMSAQLQHSARTAGRLRLAGRGCPRLSVGIAIVATGSEGAEALVPMSIGDSNDRVPLAGPRGEERRNRTWSETGSLETDESNCESAHQLIFFRALHGADGGVESVETTVLEPEVCTLFGHELTHGDIDHDGSTEIRLRTRTSGILDMSAGAERHEWLRIFDLSDMRLELEAKLGERVLAEVMGYGGEELHADFALRDLDGDGDRDVLIQGRGISSERNPDDTDEERTHFTLRQAYAYEPDTDEWRRAEELDQG